MFFVFVGVLALTAIPIHPPTALNRKIRGFIDQLKKVSSLLTSQCKHSSSAALPNPPNSRSLHKVSRLSALSFPIYPFDPSHPLIIASICTLSSSSHPAVSSLPSYFFPQKANTTAITLMPLKLKLYSYFATSKPMLT
jgi:hypothetical protein